MPFAARYARVARSNDSLLTEYGGTRGSLGLRRLLSTRFAEDGVSLPPDQTLLTGSGTHAIDLIAGSFFVPATSCSWMIPAISIFGRCLRAHKAKVVGVPYTSTGPDIARFEAALVAEKPRLYIRTRLSITQPARPCRHRPLTRCSTRRPRTIS